MWLIRELIHTPLKRNTKENTDVCYLNPSLLSTLPRLRRSHIIKSDERYNHRNKAFQINKEIAGSHESVLSMLMLCLLKLNFAVEAILPAVPYIATV